MYRRVVARIRDVLQKNRTVRYLLLATALVLVSIAYYPGLRGPFVFDDQSNITRKPAIAITSLDAHSLYEAAFASDSGPLRRPLASLSFALNYYAAGGIDDSFPYKVTNLSIHLINVGLVYWLASLLLMLSQRSGRIGRGQLACVPPLVAIVWGLHPLQLTSVLYVVQRMTSLSALFVLVGLILFIYGRQRVLQDKRRGIALMTLGWAIGLGLGVAAKENAVVLPLYMLVIEFIFFRDASRRKSATLTRFYLATAFAPLLLAALWILLQPQIITDAYLSREFTVLQRLLTEPRVLWFYLSLLVFPVPARFSLFHDDLAISTTLFTPWTTAVAGLGIAAALFLALAGRWRFPLVSFAILWYLAGHSLESSVVGLELVHEHRNYLPDFGPLYAIVVGTFRLFARAHVRPAAAAVPISIVLVILGAGTFVRAQTWASEESLIRHMVMHHPASPWSHAMMAEMLLVRENDAAGARTHYIRAAELAPYEVGYRIRAATTPLRLRPPNEALDVGLTDGEITHITEHLSSQRITHTALAALASAWRCVTEQPVGCGVLYPAAITWHRAALANPQLTTYARHNLVIQLFEMAFEHHDYRLALATAIAAQKVDSSNADYMLMEINSNIAMGEVSTAEQLLSRLDHTDLPLSPEIEANIAALRTMLRDRQTINATK